MDQAVKRGPANKCLKVSKISKLNFQCGSYIEMIFWNSSLTIELPLTKKLKDDQLIDFVNKLLSRGISILKKCCSLDQRRTSSLSIEPLLLTFCSWLNIFSSFEKLDLHFYCFIELFIEVVHIIIQFPQFWSIQVKNLELHTLQTVKFWVDVRKPNVI